MTLVLEAMLEALQFMLVPPLGGRSASATRGSRSYERGQPFFPLKAAFLYVTVVTMRKLGMNLKSKISQKTWVT